MQALGGNYRLRCHIWGKDIGEDSGLNGSNDPLYENDPALAKGKWITTDGIHTVFNNTSVDTASLDEDDTFQDEIIARFSCVPNSNMVLGNATAVSSPKVSGNF